MKLKFINFRKDHVAKISANQIKIEVGLVIGTQTRDQIVDTDSKTKKLTVPFRKTLEKFAPNLNSRVTLF